MAFVKIKEYNPKFDREERTMIINTAMIAYIYRVFGMGYGPDYYVIRFDNSHINVKPSEANKIFQAIGVSL